MNEETTQAEVQTEETLKASTETVESSDQAYTPRQEPDKKDALISLEQSRRAKAEARAIKSEEALQRLSLEREQDQRDRDRRELEAAADDPEKQSALKVRQDNRREFERRDREFKEKETAMEAKYNDAAELSTKTGAPMSDLMKATSYEHMEALAELHKVKAKESTPQEAPHYASGISDAPGKRSFTADSIANMSDKEYAEHEGALLEAQRQGKIK